MFQQILVPTNGGDQIEAALPLIRHLAKRHGARVVLLNVAPQVVNMGAVIENSSAVANHVTHVRRIEEIVERLQRDGIDTHYDIGFGRPDRGIRSSAEHHGSDVIVMTPERRERFGGLVHPSITARVFAQAPAPLLIWPEEAQAVSADVLSAPEAFILVPLDGSDLAERALPFALALSEDYKRPLRLVRVVPSTRKSTHLAESYTAGGEDSAAAVEATSYLQALAERLSTGAALPIQTEISTGDAAQEVVDIAKECPSNLIVIGTHGTGPMTRQVLGSVVNQVMWNATVPVLIVPPHAHAPVMTGEMVTTDSRQSQ